MKPSELYQLEPENVFSSNEIYNLDGHVPEIDDFWSIDRDRNTLIEIHCYKDVCFDGRRVWTLSAVKFDGEFVMVIQNAGREGEDHVRRFITDNDRYSLMVSYLLTLIVDQEQDGRDIVGIDDDIPDLTSFYSHTLDELFKEGPR